jgi:hypothetical protein
MLALLAFPALRLFRACARRGCRFGIADPARRHGANAAFFVARSNPGGSNSRHLCFDKQATEIGVA